MLLIPTREHFCQRVFPIRKLVAHVLVPLGTRRRGRSLNSTLVHPSGRLVARKDTEVSVQGMDSSNGLRHLGIDSFFQSRDDLVYAGTVPNGVALKVTNVKNIFDPLAQRRDTSLVNDDA